MKVATAIAKVLKAEGVDILFAYPVNPIIEAAAREDIRTIIVRQERTGAAHGGCLFEVVLWREDRCLLYAARAGC